MLLFKLLEMLKKGKKIIIEREIGKVLPFLRKKLKIECNLARW
jgi:hypothetical protein